MTFLNFRKSLNSLENSLILGVGIFHVTKEKTRRTVRILYIFCEKIQKKTKKMPSGLFAGVPAGGREFVNATFGHQTAPKTNYAVY